MGSEAFPEVWYLPYGARSPKSGLPFSSFPFSFLSPFSPILYPVPQNLRALRPSVGKVVPI